MRSNYRKKCRELYAKGFSVSELAIMYHVPEYKVEAALEEVE